MSNRKRDSAVDDARSRGAARLFAEERERLSVPLFRESIFRQSSLRFGRDSASSRPISFHSSRRLDRLVTWLHAMLYR